MAGMKEQRMRLPGSEKTAPADARRLGPVAPETRCEVTVRLRRRPSPPAEGTRAAGERFLSRREFADLYGADPEDLRNVEAFLHSCGLDILRASLAERAIRAGGTAAAMRRAFGVTLAWYQSGRRRFRGRSGAITIPTALAGIIEGVFGLDDRPHARSYFRIARPPKRPRPGAAPGQRAFTPPEIAALYGFPSSVDGSGQCIGLIELGGGYRLADLAAYFQGLGLAVPRLTAVAVDGAANAPGGGPDGPDGEVMLDIEIAGAIAPGAAIVVYFAPNTYAGFLDAVTAAVHDDLRKPSVISISWGNAERSWTGQAIQALDSVCADAGTLGITVCAAAGDSGASGTNPPTRRANVDFPASSPNALACGGTELRASGGRIESETVWNEPAGGATGGGVSEVFPLPSYQQGIGVPPSLNAGHAIGRGVPDVAGDADPNSGYAVRVDGEDIVVGGTSAVAPLWAALIALINQSRGRPLGAPHAALYALGKSGRGFHDIVEGNNAIAPYPGYPAKPGWDACTGWGSPDGQALVAGLG